MPSTHISNVVSHANKDSKLAEELTEHKHQPINISNKRTKRLNPIHQIVISKTDTKNHTPNTEYVEIPSPTSL
jgi:DNA polymerase IIIc chi subunit